MTPQIKPLSYRHRNFFFYALASAFFLSLPFLFLYATSTKEWRGVRLFEGLNKDVFASFVGPYEQMPYYYCAETFPPYDASTSTSNTLTASAAMSEVVNPDQEDELVLPVQSVSPNKICEPVIKIDRANEEVSYFDFFPNSTDLVVLSQESGIYVVEIDDRAWQNRQPMLLAKDLKTIVYNGAVYAYDGNYIYQIIITQNWF